MADFAPQYLILVTLPDGVYSLTSLSSLSTGLTTSSDLGGLDLILADPTGQIGTILGRSVQGLPVALNAPITVQCTNIFGETGTCWSGYITSAGPSFDSNSGTTYHITAGDALKVFAVQTQSAAQVSSLTISEMANLTASQVLQFAATSIGLPASKLNIDVLTDAGSGINQSIPPATFISPQQASWLAVLNGVAQFTGNILFADEQGIIQYRPINYQRLPVRSIPAPIVHQYALANTDEELLTHVEVRYGLVPIASAAPVAPTPNSAQAGQLAGWDQQLGQRKLITYLPWLLNAKAAQWAASTLLAQGMAEMGVGQVTILGDHAYHVGDTVRLDFAGKDAFIQSVSQQWQWGGQWLTTLGLTFVRDAGSTLPTSVQPANLVQAGFPDTSLGVGGTGGIGANQQITLSLVPTASKTLVPAGYDVVGPPSLYPTGTYLILSDATTGSSPLFGQDRQNASYRVFASPTQPDGVLTVYDPTHAQADPEVVDAVVLLLDTTAISDAAQAAGGTLGGLAGAGLSTAQSALAKLTNPPPGNASTPGRFVPATQGGAWRDKVLRAAMLLYDKAYTFTGITFDSLGQAVAFSCVAFVWEALSTSGYISHLSQLYPQDPYVAFLSTGQYQQHILANIPGAQHITPAVPSNVQQGDILLFSGTGGTWAGDYDPVSGLTLSHATFALGVFSGTAITYNPTGNPGTPYQLDTKTAMVGAENSSQGVSADDYASDYWKTHLAMIVRPDYL